MKRQIWEKSSCSYISKALRHIRGLYNDFGGDATVKIAGHVNHRLLEYFVRYIIDQYTIVILHKREQDRTVSMCVRWAAGIKITGTRQKVKTYCNKRSMQKIFLLFCSHCLMMFPCCFLFCFFFWSGININFISLLFRVQPVYCQVKLSTAWQ